MKNKIIKNYQGLFKSRLLLLGTLLIILLPAFTIAQAASDQAASDQAVSDQLASDSWMDEMEKAKGMSVGDLEPRFGDPGNGDSDGTGTDGETTTGIEQSDRDDDADQAGPVNPDTLDPNDPKVVNYIKQWTSSARPPQNAVSGSNWRYDKFGRVLGSGPGLRTIGAHDSVDYGGGTPEATAWSLRKKLDSVDHCTLEEYVVAKLGKKSISQCAGRYGAVKDLKGIKLSEAKSSVTGAGFKYTLAPGTPANTPQEEGTIERQEPEPTTYLKKGQTLKLIVYAPHVPGKLTLPDFMGKSLKESKKWLENNKLKINLQPGSSASSEHESGTIEAQEPAPKTVMQAGGTVILKVHSDYVDTRGVPKIVGLSVEKAKKDLLNDGLIVTLKPGGKPATREQAGTVERQSPEAGSSIPSGSEVSIFVYGPYVDTIVIPDVRNLFYNDAKNRMEAAGLTMSKQDAGRPSNQNLSDKAYKQDPPSGTEVSRGQTVQVWFYSQYNLTREDQLASKDCSGYPGTRAFWDENTGQPKCGCFDGLRWNLNNSACVSEQDFAREWCAKNRPGRIAVRKADGGYECKCPDGYVWDGNTNRCKTPPNPPVNRNDLTGKWLDGKKVITKEGGYYICRQYTPPSSYAREGYQRGMIVLKFNASRGPSSTYQGKHLMFRHQESPIWLDAVIEHIINPRTKREDLKINYELDGKKYWVRFGRFMR